MPQRPSLLEGKYEKESVSFIVRVKGLSTSEPITNGLGLRQIKKKKRFIFILEWALI